MLKKVQYCRFQLDIIFRKTFLMVFFDILLTSKEKKTKTKGLQLLKISMSVQIKI